MSGRILDGRAIASRSWRELSDRVGEVVAAGHPTPRLAVIRFTDSGPAAVYAASVARAARSIGIEVVDVRPADGSPRSDVAARIGALNRDPSIAGIVVSQPLPAGLEGRPIVDEIDPAKDVDGATQASAGRLARGSASFVPATALAVLEILRGYDIPLAGRRAVVVGRSAVVGRPTAALLTAADATVVLCHRGTRNLARETRRAEILVAAAGVPGTMGDAGLLVQEKDFPAIAELVHRVVRDPTVRAAVVAGQRARLRTFDADTIGATLREHLETLASVEALR